MKLSWKLAIPQIIVVLGLGLISFIIINISFIRVREWYVQKIFDTHITSLMRFIDDAAVKSVDEASLFSALPSVQDAYKLALSGDIDDPFSPQVQEGRELLRRELAPMQEGRKSINGDKIKLHFHLPNGRSFLRLWRDKNSVIDGIDVDFSDDLESMRSMVLDVNKSGKAATGIESGPSGFFVRGLVPIFSADGKQLGSVGSMQDFHPILKFIAADEHISLLLFANDEILDYALDYQNPENVIRNGNFVQIAEYISFDVDEYITPELLEKGRTGTSYEIMENITLASFPMIDYQGKQAGVSVMALDTEDIVVRTRTAAIILSSVLTVMIIISIILHTFQVRGFVTKPLSRVKNMMQDIAEDRADFTAYVPVNQHDEIGELVDNFNKLLIKLSGILHERHEMLNKIENNFRKAEEMERWYRAILDTVPFSISIQDTEMRYIFINKEFEAKFCKKSRKEFVGRPCNRLQTSICGTENCSVLCAKRGEQRTFFDHDGLSYQVNVATLKGSQGEVAGYLEVIQDITETEQLRQLAEAENQSKSIFLANMSHEIRTPLNAVIGMTTIGQNEKTTERMKYCFSRIESASVHLLGVINDILDMSKIEANKFELSPVNFQFDTMIQRVLNVNEFRADEKHQQLSVHIDEHIPHNLIGDDQRLAQVITNLLGNAVKFTPEYGSVALDARFLGEENGSFTIQIAVKDTGIGISAAQQQKLFQPFQQAESGTVRNFGGTGLGLVISKNIVEMMGGKIWVESELGKGSEFMFTVSMERGEETASAAQEHYTEEHRGAQNIDGCFADRHILLAEDVDINREIVLTVLEPTGAAIDCAVNGAEAVRLFKENPDKYDMIFMDVQMPEMDGYEATKHIRSIEVSASSAKVETRRSLRKPIPIIAMTANVFREDVEKSLAAGMNGHIGKPINFDEMLKLMRDYLE
ncbi:MAG: response regulator [Treponema sp.]|jgi:PAS domain S-box-containing protein|nr:response regulator [Treponema sp.]